VAAAQDENGLCSILRVERLRLTFPVDDRGSANKIEMNASATAHASSIIMTEKKLREFQERHRAVLESSAQSL
jgi:hypothetical protein